MSSKDKPGLKYAMMNFKSGMGNTIKFITFCFLSSCVTLVTMTYVLDTMTSMTSSVSLSSFNLKSSFNILNRALDASNGFPVKVLPPFTSDEAMALLHPSNFSYLTVIDAGSSGCRAHVFRYGKLGSNKGSLYILPAHDSLKVKPGLSSFKANPENAGASLQGLVDFMKEKVPIEQYGNTPIWLKATAGLRMLKESQSEAILTSVRNFLSSTEKSPFLFRPEWAKVISGQEEGATGWLAYNYLMKIVGPKERRHSNDGEYAVVEMGGASSQVTQRAPANTKVPDGYKYQLNIDGEQIQVYTHSYLGYGGEQGREALNKLITPTSIDTKTTAVSIEDPCLNNGLVLDRADGTLRTSVYEGPALDKIKTTMKGVSGGAQVQLQVSIADLDRAVHRRLVSFPLR